MTNRGLSVRQHHSCSRSPATISWCSQTTRSDWRRTQRSRRVYLGRIYSKDSHSEQFQQTFSRISWVSHSYYAAVWQNTTSDLSVRANQCIGPTRTLCWLLGFELGLGYDASVQVIRQFDAVFRRTRPTEVLRKPFDTAETAFFPVLILLIYVAARATYIRLLHGKIGFLGGFSALAP